MQKDIDAIEKVQRRAARFVKSDYGMTSSVTSMLADLGWNSLANRRRDARLALMFKIVHGHIAVPVDSLQLKAADSRTRASHEHKYKTQGANTKEFGNSFVHITLAEWNSLPASVAEADSVQSFKAQLAGLARV